MGLALPLVVGPWAESLIFLVPQFPRKCRAETIDSSEAPEYLPALQFSGARLNASSEGQPKAHVSLKMTPDFATNIVIPSEILKMGP